MPLLPTTTSTADLRTVHIYADEQQMAEALCKHVGALACASIATKGSFSLAIPSGSVVEALSGLSQSACPWNKVHVFFTNERVGQNKSYAGAMDAFATRCGCPNVHKLPSYHQGRWAGRTPAEAAAAYEALISTHPAIDKIDCLPAFDCMLLGVGEDGHCGSLHPNSDATRATGSGRLVLPVYEEGKNAVTVSMDVMRASKKVILAACGDKKQEAVKAALGGQGFPEWSCPAGLLVTPATTWYIDAASAAAWQATPMTICAPRVDESPDVNLIRRGIPPCA